MNENIGITVNTAHDPDSRYGLTKPEGIPPADFESEEMRQKHLKLMEWWLQCREVQSINRYQQAIDADFYDGLQWSDEDRQVLLERNQAPLVFNKIKPALDWVTGTEKRTRVDYNVYPRRKDNNNDAQVKKDVLKYLSDVNKTPFSRSRAFFDAATVGVGWLEDSISGDDTKELLQSKYESWRNVWYDHLSCERDLSDSRYLFRSKFVDLDVAIAMFPQAKFILEQAASKIDGFGQDENEDDDFFYATRVQSLDTQGNVLHRHTFSASALVSNRRQRVRLIECWYREPVTKKIWRGGEYDGDYFDENDPKHVAMQQEDYASLNSALVMRMHCAMMTEGHLLQRLESPYKHNDFPMTPIWCFRRSRDNAPYGIVRNIRDPQEDLNKRASKALHVLSTNQIVAEEDAATDWDEIKDQAAMPDGMILLNGRTGARFDLNNDKKLAQEHIMLMDRDAQMIQDVSGVTDENMGKDTNAQSGRAITARQNQGSVVVADLFDNLRYAIQLQGEKQLALIEQFYTDEKIIRITGYRGSVKFVAINEPAYDQQSGTWVMKNPMTASKADFVVDEQDYQASMRAAMFESMNQMLSTFSPEISLQLLDLVYENTDLPGRDKIVARIRKINGQSDPSAEETPESLAKEQAKQQAEQEAANIELQQAKLVNAKLQAEIDKLKAEAAVKGSEGLYSLIQGAQAAAMNPLILPIADEMGKSVGFEDKNGAPIANPVAQSAGNNGIRQLSLMPVNTDPRFPANPESSLTGVRQGIETQRADG